MKKLVLLFVAVAVLAQAAPMKLDAPLKKKLNVFFSNFSEAYMKSFPRADMSDDIMLNFAFRHLYINKFKELKVHKGGMAMLATIEQVDTVTMKYFGRKIQTGREKTYSIPCSDGEAYTFSQIESFEELPDKTFQAHGSVFASGPEVVDPHGTPETWKKAGAEVEKIGTFIAKVAPDKDRYFLLEYAFSELPSAQPDNTGAPGSASGDPVGAGSSGGDAGSANPNQK